MSRIIRLSVLAMFLSFSMLGIALAQETDDGTLTFDGRERTYTFYTPDSIATDSPAPLLVALHPFASSGRAMATSTNLNDMADEYGFAVVYPDSVGLFWNDGRIEAGLATRSEPRDDVGFILALIDDLANTYDIDTEQVLLTGIDSGGTLAYTLACEHGDRFAGAALINTTMWDFQQSTCPEAAESGIDILMTASGVDVLYPVLGRSIEGAEAFEILGIRDTLAYWLVRNDCTLDMFDRYEYEVTDTIYYPDCADDTRVAAVIWSQTSHNWPRTGYAVNDFGIDASQMIASFFFEENDSWRPSEDLETQSGIARSFRYYVPSSYSPDTPMPLVIALHGRPDNSIGISQITEFSIFAEENDFIAVYPDGVNQQGWAVVNPAIDDLNFFDAMLDDLIQDLNVDESRIYMTGFSNGGFMTQRVACSAPERFAAFAVVGATLFPEYEVFCGDSDAAPFIFIHGTSDLSVPWEGDIIQNPDGSFFASYPIQATVAFWAERNSCDQVSEVEIIEPQGDNPQSRVVIHTFQGCADETPLFLYEIENGGHNWPGVPGVISSQIAGEVNTDVHASQVIWDFLSQFENTSE